MISTFLLACVFLPAGYLFARKTFGKIDQNALLMNKLTKYQTGHIIRLATCEGVGLLSIVSLMLTSNLFFLIFLLVSFFIMVLYYPTPEKIGSEINLTQNEIEMFND
jgi:UDP:flavonoid glycosyltransferase YjiC (YdhE family)